MAIAVANCSQTPSALDKQKQSMWQRLGWRKLLGRDDRESDSQDETSEHSRAKHDNLTRRISRKVGVGIPKKRQSSDLERLAPREPDHRRALSADRRPMSAQRTRTRSPPPTDPRQSAPEIQWLGPPTTTVDESENDGMAISDWDPYPDPYPDPDPELNDMDMDMDMDMDISKGESEAEDPIDLEMELEQRWILNLSMHFRDRSEREKFFVTYAETPNRWRRVTVSCDYRDAPPGSLEDELKGLRYQRDKCARIYESIRESLLGIRFYDGVTNLKLETSDGQLHVFVTEDVNETIPYPPISSIGHLVGAPMVPEHMLHFESHLSGFVYKVNFGGRYYIKKEIPGPDTVDEFLYEINALHALNGIPSVIQTEGIVIDEERCVVKGLLISYAEQGALIDILYENHGRTEFARRERWAKQIVQGLCEIHESGYVQGDFTLANIVVDAADNAKIIDINRRGCPVGWEPPEIAAKIESNQRISMYIGVKTDLFQLGMTLWALAMEDDEPERQPRPLYLSEDAKVPDYYRRIVQICLSPNPRHRLSAKELLVMFPSSVHTMCIPAARPLQIVPNHPGYLPQNDYDWSQHPPPNFGMTDPRDMMPQDDHYYAKNEFLDGAYRGLQQPIFDKRGLEKPSTVTLAEANGDTAFSSKPSSSSTLNHHEATNKDGYLDYSRYPDEPSYHLPSENQGNVAAPDSYDTTRKNVHGQPKNPLALSDEPSDANTPIRGQQPPITRDMSTGSTGQRPKNLPAHADNVTSASLAPKTPPKPQDAKWSNQKATKEDDILKSSCLSINPALSSPQTPQGSQSAPTTTIPPSTPTERDDSNKPFTKSTDTKSTFSGSSPARSLIGSGSSMSPKAGITGASLGLGTKFPAASPFTNMLRQSGGQQGFKSAGVKPTTTSYTATSSVQPSIPISTPNPTQNSVVDSSRTTLNARSNNAVPTQSKAMTIDAVSSLASDLESSSLLGSSLPISPASVDSDVAPITQAVRSSDMKTSELNALDTKPAWTSPQKPEASTLDSKMPVSLASINPTPISKVANGSYVKPTGAPPTLLRSPDSTSSLIDSRLPISPATVNSKSIAEAVNQPYTPPINTKHIFPRPSDSAPSLLSSRLPISPASTNSASGTEHAERLAPKPAYTEPILARPSDSISLLSSQLPISPSLADAVPVATSMGQSSIIPSTSSPTLLDSSLPISPASMNSFTPAQAPSQSLSKSMTRFEPAESPDSSSLLSSSLPISPASADSNPAVIMNAPLYKPATEATLAQPSDQSILLSSSLPISPAFVNPAPSPATAAVPAAHRAPASQVSHPVRHRPATYFSRAAS
ncbi:unnamed protein product [Penicillium salamii]|uniref:Protein kinase domain-containing protein n=1 Tax=Penicillium salamii TaxID=1612424 RepID=A0A9W4JHH3_9EURO|nr:unnamed protein product [Penicillium salamii]CAG8399348.1 unnamed protein product [Penicillium salamii]CAG8414863.1 unnamed protein product [Penicillium salamii]